MSIENLFSHLKGKYRWLLDRIESLQILNFSQIHEMFLVEALERFWCSRQADWLLLDGLKGGSGQTYDWERLQKPPLQEGMQGWLLAGGLTPQNVGQAVSLTRPSGVDVSSGVTGPNGITKDRNKILQFVKEVRQAAVA